MKKAPARATRGNLRAEYDLAKLGGGLRGKYYAEATAKTNLVLIDADLMELFPDGEAVNRALRSLAETSRAASHAPRRRAR